MNDREDPKAIVNVWKPIPLSEEEYAERDPFGIFDPYQCPDCHALIKNGICLNACHLSAGAYRRFMQGMHSVAAKMRSNRS